MKLLLATLILFIYNHAISGVGGSAGGSSASWNKIMASSKYAVKFPKIRVDGEGIRFVEINHFCENGLDLVTTKKFPIYGHLGPGESVGFEEIGRDYLRAQIISQKTICRGNNDFGYCKPETFNKEIPLSYELTVEKNYGKRGQFKKVYNVPTCE